mgnify:FL=1
MKEKIINPGHLFSGRIIPKWLIERKEISASAKVIYAELTFLWDKADESGVETGRRDIAKATGMSIKQIDGGLAELKLVKLLEAEKDGFQKPNNYSFFRHVLMKSEFGYFIL